MSEARVFSPPRPVVRPTRLSLLTCPFCGRTPKAQQWHGGGPLKIMISCTAELEGECDPGPMVTGETPQEAQNAWNHRVQGTPQVVDIEWDQS